MAKVFKEAPRAANAFTLVEVIVVMAIIALLAAMVFAAFAVAPQRQRQRQQSPKTSCLSNTNQLGKAMLMYLQDYNGKFHDADMGRAEPAANGFGPHISLNAYDHWPWFYGPYVNSVSVFDCPTSPDTSKSMASANWDNDGNYGYNYDGLTRGAFMPSLTLGEIEKPAEVYVFFDSGDSDVVSGANTYTTLLESLDVNLNCGSSQWSNYSKEAAFRHFGHTNVTFVDGHSKSVKWSNFIDRKADNVAPWMIDWADCTPDCAPPVAGPGQCFNPALLP